MSPQASVRDQEVEEGKMGGTDRKDFVGGRGWAHMVTTWKQTKRTTRNEKKHYFFLILPGFNKM